MRKKVPSTIKRKGTIGFITTPNYRKRSSDLIKEFIFMNMYFLCNNFSVQLTQRTYKFIELTISKKLSKHAQELIRKDMGISRLNEFDIKRWRQTIRESLLPTAASYQGMIHITFELVEGRLDAVIHLSDWEDKSGKPDSAVLAREANVHNVPFASDPDTALAHIGSWRKQLVDLADGKNLFRVRTQPNSPPLDGLNEKHRVLAMVAHDNMKLEICRFAVEHAVHIFTNYDYILATGTTGGWIQAFMEAAGRSPMEVKKIRRCNSGPLGGDVQIAEAVVKGFCRKVIFLQDPSVSHPHDSDIRLFEQAVLARDVHVELATNVDSAKLLIGA